MLHSLEVPSLEEPGPLDGPEAHAAYSMPSAQASACGELAYDRPETGPQTPHHVAKATTMDQSWEQPVDSQLHRATASVLSGAH